MVDSATSGFDQVPLRHPDGSAIASPSTVRAAVAIAEAVFARNMMPPPADRIAFLAREIEDFLARSGVRARLMLSAMVWLVTVVAPLLIGRVALLGSLPLGVRVRALTRLEERFGDPLLAVKAILCLIYYEHPDAAREVGFDGACLLPGAHAALPLALPTRGAE